IILFLLANPAGGKIKDVQRWSGYTYRNIWATAKRLQAAGVVTIEHGYFYLQNQKPWHALAPYDARNLIIVDWFAVFDALIRLLKELKKAEKKELTLESHVVHYYCQQANKELSSALFRNPDPHATTIKYLLNAITI